MKKIISLFLAATMMFSVLGSVTFVQASEWSAGDNVTVSVSGNVITVSGNGDMNDYSASNLPDWHDNNGDITKIVIESGVTSIGDFAFSSFMSVTGVDIANTVTRIGERAFSGCMMLKAINIPASVSEIGECAFSTNIGSLSNLSEITVDSSNKYFTVVDGILYNSAKTIMYKIPSKANITSLQVPESTISIRKEAAAACSSLEEVNLPESVASVGAKAFADCSNLSKVVVNNRDCMLSLGSVPDNEGLQLFGYKGTNVELYKQNNGCKNIEFVPLDSESETLTATLSKTSYTYDGNEKNPTVTVKDSSGKTLVKGTDYTVTYDDDRTNVGTYNVTVTYIGEYTGTDVLSFKVIPQIPERCTPVLSKTSYTYDGNEKNPTVTIKDVVNNVLVNGTDYTLTYDADRTNVGTYNVTITYKGNYSGTTKLSFTVIQQIPERCTPKLSETTYKYDGSEKTPTVTITDVVNNVLKEGTDYTLTYDEGRTEPGTYNVKITYKGNYSGTDTLSFDIVDKSSASLTATLSKESYTYDGNEKNPTVTVKDSSGKTLVKGTDYTVTYDDDRTNVGTYNVTVTYIGEYTGTDVLSFKVIPQIPERCTPVLSKTSYTYDGNEKNPTVTIKDVVNNVLVNGTDYTLTYDADRTNVGTYNVTITYKGNYSGTDTVSFKVIEQIPERCTPKLSETTYKYDGSEKTPTVTIIDVVNNVLKEGTDYTLTYDEGRTEPGTYNVKITYKGNYSGTATLSFYIVDTSSENLTATLSKTSYTYDGNEKNPTVTVKDSSGKTLVKGTDYTVTYDAGRTNVGTYNVKVTYIGKYSGTATLSFKVIQQIPSRCTATLSATQTYYTGTVKTPGVSIKDVVGNVLKNGTDYTVTMDSGRKNVGRYAVVINYKGNYSGSQTLYFNIIPKGITGITKITSKSKGFTVQWATQQTATTGYQVQYSTSSSFSNATTITMPKNVYYAKSVTGLTGNKKYYVRIRTYTQTKFNGSNYNIYSPWCAVKSVVTGK